ncbi:MAG: ABC transporter permease [Chloroflexota bacterium]
MKVIWVVFSKEFIDIVRDRRRFLWMLVSSFILFPVLFVGPYAFLLTRVVEQTAEDLTIPVQGMEYAPELIAYLMEEHDIEAFAVEDVESLVRDKEYAAGLIIPPDYAEQLAGGGTVELTLISDLRRSMDVTSSRLSLALEEYGQELMTARLSESGLSDEFLNPLQIEMQNAATATETAGSMLGLIIPGIIISMGLSAGMPIAISTVAGEKKKMTLEPVLFTTVSRFQLVFAKLLAVLVSVFLNLFSMVLSMAVAGTLLVLVLVRSLPMDKLLASAESGASPAAPSTPAAEMLTGGYNLQPLAILLFLLAPFLIILFGAALQLLVSAWARNDEEATTYLTPLSLFSGLIIFVAFFLDEYVPKLWHYGLPVFGTILSMRDLLSNKVDPASLTVMFLSSALYAGLMLALAVWLFHREEVVFRT